MRTTQLLTTCTARAAVAVLISGSLLTAGWSTSLAAPVTSKQAAAAVTGWLRLDPAPLGETLGNSVRRLETFNDSAGNPLYYVAYLDPSGFVIVAADDQVEPIVGFAIAGQFDPSADNPLGVLVSNDLAARIACVRQAGAVPPDTNSVQAQAKWQLLCPTNGAVVMLPMGLSSVPRRQDSSSDEDHLGPANRRRGGHDRLLQLLHSTIRGRQPHQLSRRLHGYGLGAVNALLPVSNLWGWGSRVHGLF